MFISRMAVAVAASLLVGACGASGSAGSGATGAGGANGSPGARSADPNVSGDSAAGTATHPVETNVSGDIPDTQQYVEVTPAGGGFTIRVPEGWARTESAGRTTFSDKLNSITVQEVSLSASPTEASVRSAELPALQRATDSFQLGSISTVQRTAGAAVLTTYQSFSAPDPVTNRVVHDDSERYEFWRNGREVVLTLTAPSGSDNVDPWRKVTDSFTWK